MKQEWNGGAGPSVTVRPEDVTRGEPSRLFKPDERPPAPYAPLPFTPEQEARLRQIAWEAAEAHNAYRTAMTGGTMKAALAIRDAFLEGRS